MNILVAPFMVQGRLDADVSFSAVDSTQAAKAYEAVPDERLVSEARAVADIRLTRPDARRTLIVRKELLDSSELEPTRLGAWALTHALLESVQDGPEPNTIQAYMLRDQKQYHPDHYSDIHQGTIGSSALCVRSEEGLLYRAHELIEDIKDKTATDPAPGMMLCDDGHGDCITRANQDGATSHLPLRGYEFNPRDTGKSERVRFEHYPSCEVFLAASALEQLDIADSVIRICHYSLRNRDTAARSLLQAAGYTDAAVETVVLNDEGTPNKMFAWHNDKSLSKTLRTLVREVVSEQVRSGTTSDV